MNEMQKYYPTPCFPFQRSLYETKYTCIIMKTNTRTAHTQSQSRWLALGPMLGNTQNITYISVKMCKSLLATYP